MLCDGVAYELPPSPGFRRTCKLGSPAQGQGCWTMQMGTCICSCSNNVAPGELLTLPYPGPLPCWDHHTARAPHAGPPSDAVLCRGHPAPPSLFDPAPEQSRGWLTASTRFPAPSLQLGLPRGAALMRAAGISLGAELGELVWGCCVGSGKSLQIPLGEENQMKALPLWHWILAWSWVAPAWLGGAGQPAVGVWSHEGSRVQSRCWREGGQSCGAVPAHALQCYSHLKDNSLEPPCSMEGFSGLGSLVRCKSFFFKAPLP